MHDADATATSIGQEDQLRDREMLRAERTQDSLKGDAEPDAAPDAPNAWPAGGAPPKLPDTGEESDDDWQPGDADPPDRAGSEGLTGSGPAQPDA